MNVRPEPRNGGCTAEVCYVAGKVEVVNGYVDAEAMANESLGASARPRSENATLLLVGVPVAAFVAQVVVCDAYYTALTRVYSGLLAALTAFSLTRLVIFRPQRMPAVEYALCLYYATFGLATSAGPTAAGLYGVIPRPEAYEDAAALVLVAAVAMMLAHAAWELVPSSSSHRRYMPRLTAGAFDAASGFYVPIAAVLVVLLAAVPSIRVRLSSVLAIILMFVDVVPLVAVATLAYALQPRARTLGQLVVAMAASGAVMARTSMLSGGMIAAAAAGAVWWRVRGRVPLVFIGGTVALLVILQPVKSYYREIVWDDRGSDVGVVEGWQRAFSTAGADRYRQSGVDATRERLSDLATLAYVMDLVPRSMDYMGGDAYEQVLIAMVPRIVWPDKPNMTKAGLDRYVISLGLSTPELADRSTTGIQLVTHGYAAHGSVGGVAWMALFGFALGAVSRFFGQGIGGTIAMTSFMASWPATMGVGFVNCFGSLWQVVVGALGLVWALTILGRAIRVVPGLRVASHIREG